MKKEIKARSRSAKHGTRLMGEGNALRPYENEEGFLKAARRWMSLHIVTQGILSGLAMLLEIAMFFITFFRFQTIFYHLEQQQFLF